MVNIRAFSVFRRVSAADAVREALERVEAEVAELRRDHFPSTPRRVGSGEGGRVYQAVLVQNSVTVFHGHFYWYNHCYKQFVASGRCLRPVSPPSMKRAKWVPGVGTRRWSERRPRARPWTKSTHARALPGRARRERSGRPGMRDPFLGNCLLAI